MDLSEVSVDKIGDPADIWVALSELLESAQRPSWHRQAACRGAGADTFFVGKGESTKPAKALCDRCTVRAECLAASDGERFGVWGGLSEKQRRHRRRIISVSGREAA